MSRYPLDILLDNDADIVEEGDTQLFKGNIIRY